MRALVLDSDALSVLARTRSGEKFEKCLAYLKAALQESAHVLIPAAVLQEQYRGNQFYQSIDAFLSRYSEAIELIPTTSELARRAGNLQGKYKLDSRYSTDALVVAVAGDFNGIILTSDITAIAKLAAGIKNVTVVGI